MMSDCDLVGRLLLAGVLAAAAQCALVLLWPEVLDDDGDGN